MATPDDRAWGIARALADLRVDWQRELDNQKRRDEQVNERLRVIDGHMTRTTIVHERIVPQIDGLEQRLDRLDTRSLDSERNLAALAHEQVETRKQVEAMWEVHQQRSTVSKLGMRARDGAIAILTIATLFLSLKDATNLI